MSMDNAGGHGTYDAIYQYTTKLLDTYNIEEIRQVPRSLFTNVLDLRVCAALQAVVEKCFMRRCSVNTLVDSVIEIWNDSSLDRVISNVFTRLQIAVCLINTGDGGNDLVETKRGIKHADIKFVFQLSLRNVMNDGEDESFRLNQY